MKIKILVITIMIIGCTFTVASDNVNTNKKKFTLDTSLWEQINDDGFGSKFNVGPRGIEVYNNSLIIGTANYNVHDGNFIYGKSPRLMLFLYNLLIEKKYSYENFKSEGCEIWSYNDTSWKQLIGDNGTMPSGFGNKNTTEVGILIVYKNYLYAGLRNEIEGCQIWRTNNLESWELVADNGFGDKKNTWAMEAEIFNDELYMGIFNRQGCEIYKTIDGTNWAAVVGGTSDTKNGFGTKDNFYAWSMRTYDLQLYVGTASTEGCEIWRSQDGKNWKPVIAYDNIFEVEKNGAHYPRAFGKYWAGGARNLVVLTANYMFIRLSGETMDSY